MSLICTQGFCDDKKLFEYLFRKFNLSITIALIDCFGFDDLSDSITVYIREREREREKEKRNDRREKKCTNNPRPHLLQAQ